MLYKVRAPVSPSLNRPKLNHTKKLLVHLNTLSVMIGLCYILAGLLRGPQYNNPPVLLNAALSFTPVSLISDIGVVILGVTIPGYFGTRRESKTAIALFTVLLSLAMMFELGACMFGYMFSDFFNLYFTSMLDYVIREYPKQTFVAQNMDILQSQFHCCGGNSSEDWYTHSNSSQTDEHIPRSCCDFHTNCTTFFSVGCISRLNTLISENRVLVVVAALIIIFTQVIVLRYSYRFLAMVGIEEREEEHRQWIAQLRGSGDTDLHRLVRNEILSV